MLTRLYRANHYVYHEGQCSEYKAFCQVNLYTSKPRTHNKNGP